MKLYYFELIDGSKFYVRENELEEVKETIEYLNVEYTINIVAEKMYAIHWYDYIDEEWSIIWCTEDELSANMKMILDSEVEYEIEIFN